MHLLGQPTLGALILIVLGAMILVKRLATGSIFNPDPKGYLWSWLANQFNLSFLLVITPLAALLLLANRYDPLDPTRLPILSPGILPAVEITGLMLYLLGALLMSWALVSLGGIYQLGGAAPRATDHYIQAGPYRIVRHPMYAAALSMSLGLACLVQSLLLLALFAVYLLLILRLIPYEEEQLRRAYPGQFAG